MRRRNLPTATSPRAARRASPAPSRAPSVSTPPSPRSRRPRREGSPPSAGRANRREEARPIAASCARTWCVRPVTSSTRTTHIDSPDSPAKPWDDGSAPSSNGNGFLARSSSRPNSVRHASTCDWVAGSHATTRSSHRFHRFPPCPSPVSSPPPRSPSALLRRSRARDLRNVRPWNAPTPNGPGYIQCVNDPRGTDAFDETSAAYVLTISLDPGVFATESLNSLTASVVLPSTSTPDVELSSLCVTRRVPGGNPSERSRHPPQCSTALDSCAMDGSLCGLFTTRIASLS